MQAEKYASKDVFIQLILPNSIWHLGDGDIHFIFLL